jgi:hypothetical protein
MKSSWEKPELVVLVRRKPDEVILATCRTSGGGPLFLDGLCRLGIHLAVCHD